MTEGRLCRFPECDRTVEAKGLCAGHCQQARKGKTLTPLRRALTSDEKREIVKLYESGTPLKNISAMFKRGDTTIRAILHDLGDGTRKPGWPVARYGSGSSHPRWLGDNIAHATAHTRCRRLWGPASDYPCIGFGGNATQWAYDGTDPTQKYGPTGKKKYYGHYSVYPEFYMPMCSPCHRRRDGEMQRLELSEYRMLKNETGLSAHEIRQRLMGAMSGG